jgi:chorismate synthase
VERSDVTVLPAAAVVAEAGVAFELARAALEKFGGDSIGDLVEAHRAYTARIAGA